MRRACLVGRWRGTTSVLHGYRCLVTAGTRADIPTPASQLHVPEFGSVRRRRVRQEEHMLRNKAALEHQAAKYEPPASQEEEDDAETYCRVRYGFTERPACLPTWKSLLHEIKSYEFRWSLTPGVDVVQHLRIVEFDENGNEKEVCHLRGDGSQCSPIADLFEGIAGVLQGTFLSFSVPFRCRAVDSGLPTLLVVEAKPMIDGNCSGGSSSGSPSDPRQSAVLPKLFAQTAKTGYLVSAHVEMHAGRLRVPVFHEISLPAFCYFHLNSIPPFLRRTDTGIVNADYLPKGHMTMFRFLWCFIRRECRLVPLEVSELDILLPPPK